MKTSARSRFELFPHRLWVRRVYQDLTQRELAEICGIHPQSIKNYERGRTAPSLRQAAVLAAALDCDPGWLAFGYSRFSSSEGVR